MKESAERQSAAPGSVTKEQPGTDECRDNRSGMRSKSVEHSANSANEWLVEKTAEKWPGMRCRSPRGRPEAVPERNVSSRHVQIRSVRTGSGKRPMGCPKNKKQKTKKNNFCFPRGGGRMKTARSENSHRGAPAAPPRPDGQSSTEQPKAPHPPTPKDPRTKCTHSPTYRTCKINSR